MSRAPRSEQELLANVYRRSAEIRRRRAFLRSGAGLIALALFATFGLTQFLGENGPGAPRTRGPGQIARGPSSPPTGPGETPAPPETPRGGNDGQDGSQPNGSGNGNEPPGGPGRIAHDQILSLPVSFSVANVNRSLVPCETDGGRYTIRGHIVGPAKVLAATPRSAMLYLHAVTAGEWLWSFTDVPRYDYATEMARLGHISVIYDRLGAGDSDNPNGNDMCMGSEADIAHQIAQQLRSGTYTLAGYTAIRFARVALTGHSASGLHAEIAASSFDDFDALVVSQWADVPTPKAVRVVSQTAQTAIAECSTGGLPAERDGTGPRGYTNSWASDDVFDEVFYNVEPAVLAGVLRLLNRDPCGIYYSAPQAVAMNTALVQTITAPTLIVVGDHDIFTVDGARLHGSRFISSDDVSVEVIPETGHIAVLERNAAFYRSVVSRWLHARGF